ncbi:hypothetical protein [Microbacterium sp. PRC9]|uniref:hypothetical protein n=1 Tax=Microbacterium sp. PRC9 TaxID=2962591 RepID=UPI00288190FF|nr:hypothetical protein [Microbacterium sp. PRC9]MDT0142398.1 hypothetical protein [Microbacterium sp. PRC9]
MAGTEVLLEDTLGHVLTEYKNYMQFSGQPGVGDYFFRWYLQNRWDGRRVDRIELEPSQPLPQYLPEPLRAFDPSDHKWIAVYIEGSADVIVNATDSDWAESRDVLLEHSIRVRELADEV